MQGPHWLNGLAADKEEDDDIDADDEYAVEDEYDEDEDEDGYDSGFEYQIKFQRCVSDCLLVSFCLVLSRRGVLAVQIREGVAHGDRKVFDLKLHETNSLSLHFLDVTV